MIDIPCAHFMRAVSCAGCRLPGGDKALLPNKRYSGPQLLSSWLHGAAPRQPRCQLPRKLGSLGPLS
jgi:hypothetical protein